jgi:hypothetical protein
LTFKSTGRSGTLAVGENKTFVVGEKTLVLENVKLVDIIEPPEAEPPELSDML